MLETFNNSKDCFCWSCTLLNRGRNRLMFCTAFILCTAITFDVLHAAQNMFAVQNINRFFPLLNLIHTLDSPEDLIQYNLGTTVHITFIFRTSFQDALGFVIII